MARILVIEDSRDIATPPDALLLDLMLPGMEGLHVCQALRSENRTAAIPIIMLTARGEQSDRIRGLKFAAGASA